MKAIITGGCGFIGSALVRRLIADGHQVLNIDKLTYAADKRNVAEVQASQRYRHLRFDICDGAKLREVFDSFAPDVVFHLAAESHVDRSIDAPADFIRTNIVGSFELLNAARTYLSSRNSSVWDHFRFIHVSTDEVYGALGEEGYFTEESRYEPNSPYSASKAGSDHIVRAWQKTYGVPTIISNCSNNYGPFQHIEKLIPTIIRKALGGQTIPIFGRGDNIRDWLYVDDHVAGLLAVHARGRVGEKYNFGGNAEVRNVDMARMICALLDRAAPRIGGKSYEDQIAFVSDRPGHDYRYAIDPTKAQTHLGWSPKENFDSGLERTVRWYLDRRDWFSSTAGHDDRLGLGLTV